MFFIFLSLNVVEAIHPSSRYHCRQHSETANQYSSWWPYYVRSWLWFGDSLFFNTWSNGSITQPLKLLGCLLMISAGIFLIFALRTRWIRKGRPLWWSMNANLTMAWSPGMELSWRKRTKLMRRSNRMPTIAMRFPDLIMGWYESYHIISSYYHVCMGNGENLNQ